MLSRRSTRERRLRCGTEHKSRPGLLVRAQHDHRHPVRGLADPRDTSKGTVRFQSGEPLAEALIDKLEGASLARIDASSKPSKLSKHSCGSPEQPQGRPFYACRQEVSHGRQDPEPATETQEAEAAEESLRVATHSSRRLGSGPGILARG